ncbi:ferredoxin [Rhodococcus sp. NPDC059968]|uniref:ferredoxin n=1 Tax=Rhodococcus sp. NPDC059968 TaxID=3347017 RepID=UPI0036712207
MRVRVDFEACIGAGQCVLAAESVFDQRDDDGIVVVLQGEPPDEELDAARQAAALCPAQAISIDE